MLNQRQPIESAFDVRWISNVVMSPSLTFVKHKLFTVFQGVCWAGVSLCDSV